MFEFQSHHVVRSDTLCGMGSGELWNQRKQTTVIVKYPLRTQFRDPRCWRVGQAISHLLNNPVFSGRNGVEQFWEVLRNQSSEMQW